MGGNREADAARGHAANKQLNCPEIKEAGFLMPYPASLEHHP